MEDLEGIDCGEESLQQDSVFFLFGGLARQILGLPFIIIISFFKYNSNNRANSDYPIHVFLLESSL